MITEIRNEKETFYFKYIGPRELFNSLRTVLIRPTKGIKKLAIDKVENCDSFEITPIFEHLYINNLNEYPESVQFELSCDTKEETNPKIFYSNSIIFTPEIPDNSIRQNLYICILEPNTKILITGHIETGELKTIALMGPGKDSRVLDQNIVEFPNAQISFLEIFSPLSAMITGISVLKNNFLMFKQGFKTNIKIGNISGEIFYSTKIGNEVLSLLVSVLSNFEDILFASYIEEHSLRNNKTLHVVTTDKFQHDDINKIVDSGIDLCLEKIDGLHESILDNFGEYTHVINDY